MKLLSKRINIFGRSLLLLVTPLFFISVNHNYLTIIILCVIVFLSLSSITYDKKKDILCDNTVVEVSTTKNHVRQSKMHIQLDERQLLLDKLHHSSIYKDIIQNANNGNYHISEETWKSLAEVIDTTFDGFTTNINSRTALSEIEIHICYLIKIGMSPAKVALFLCRNRNSISMSRRRMYKKITGEDGSAKDFDSYILSL